MSRLKVILRSTVISDFGLSTDREYIGGRKETCDIRLQAEKGISREHFKLKFEEGHWLLQSLSRFGEIYSLGQRVESIVLDHGQTFQIPPYEFSYSEVVESEVSVNDGVNSDIPIISESDKTVIGVTQQVPYIKMLSAQGDIREMLRLEFGDVWVAGRDSSCQIIIPDQRVSRRQFEIRKINGIFTVIDMDSVNGTFLNGSVVSSTDPVPLKSGDSISVLDNTMYFELHDPNFQYRIDKIDVPPLQAEDNFLQAPVENVSFDNLENISNQENLPIQIESFSENKVEDQSQINIPGGPFTGMPPESDILQNSQYYSFQPSEAPAEEKKSIYEKIKSNKPLLIGLIILFLGGTYLLSEQLNAPEVPAPVNNVAKINDPFSRLSPEQQKTVQELYEKAQSERIQSLNEMAKESLEKIHQILPEGYLDSKAWLTEVLINEQTIIKQKADEEENKAKMEANQKIQKIVAECEKLISPQATEDRIMNCLAEAISLDPQHPEILRIQSVVRKMVDQQQIQKQDGVKYEAQVQELQKMYNNAEKIREKGFPYRAMKLYEIVKKSDLPDPDQLKIKSAQKIKLILKIITDHTSKNIHSAEKAIKEGKYKLAILDLREALLYDPENILLKEKVLKYENEIRLQSMALYQESIVDESFGYIDGNETRPGAKDKWKKIMEIDLDDGEYYRKAFVKLKKYGVF